MSDSSRPANRGDQSAAWAKVARVHGEQPVAGEAVDPGDRAEHHGRPAGVGGEGRGLDGVVHPEDAVGTDGGRDLVGRRVVGGGVDQQAVAGRPERHRGREEGGGRRRVPRQPGQGEPGPEPARQPPSDQPPQERGGHRRHHDRRGADRRERERRRDRVELRAPAVGADRTGAGQRQHGAAPGDPAGRDHRPARRAAVPGDGVGGGGHHHRDEHDAAQEDGVERPGAHAAIAHDGGHERGTGPPPGEQPQRDREHGLDEAERGQLQRGAALLDQHLALAASAYEQRDRSQGDDQPGEPRGEDAHGGDALVRGAQPAAALDDHLGQPGREADRVGPPVLDLLVEVGGRILQLLAQHVGGVVEPREVRDPRPARGRRHVPGHERELVDAGHQGPVGGGVRDQQRQLRRRGHDVVGPAGQLVGQSAPEAGPVLGRAVGIGHVDAGHRRQGRRRVNAGRGQLEADRVAGARGAAAWPRCRAATGRRRPAPVTRPRGRAPRGRRSPRRPRRGCVRRWPG